jgi:signal transduction histidine kinase
MAARDEQTEFSRSETNKSLADERTKTDSHLERRHKEVEGHTTDAIASDRRRADETRARDRAEHDRHLANEHARMAKGDECLLMAEREQSDHAINKERELQDSNLVRERREKQLLVEALLSTERRRTDHNLGHERECVDRASATEQARHASTRAEMSDRELAFGILTHDLKNQSVAISIGAQLLRRQLSKDAWNRADVLKQLSVVEDSAAFMSRMVDSLLDIERFAHGKVPLSLKRTDLCLLLEGTAKLFSPVAIKKSCALLTDLYPDPLWVSVDQDRLVQAVSNLVGNAIKFTPSRGTISLAAQRDHTQVTVSVTDTGPGIAEQDRLKLFRKFSQLQKTEGGLGLGLFIAKSIVEAHGGTMWVDSTVGQGSSFRFSLPLR